MSLETRKEELMDKLSEAYFAALKLKAEAEEQATQLETAQEGIYLDQEQAVSYTHLTLTTILLV